MEALLEKARRLNHHLQTAAGGPVDFAQMARMLADLIGANVYVVTLRGEVLGYGLQDLFECSIMLQEVLGKDAFPSNYAKGLLKVEETAANLSQEARQCVFFKERACLYENKITTLIPVNGAGQRLGTLVVSRFGQPFDDEDLLLAEYSATVVAMEMLRGQTLDLENTARQKAAVRVAIGALSYSELEAIQHVFEALDGTEGLVVASRVADEAGITRSVIVNALRKFESAGVISSRSLGMKGTHIRVLNDLLLPELERLKVD
jgi:transcriptional pleiotropic repressor